MKIRPIKKIQTSPKMTSRQLLAERIHQDPMPELGQQAGELHHELPAGYDTGELLPPGAGDVGYDAAGVAAADSTYRPGDLTQQSAQARHLSGGGSMFGTYRPSDMPAGTAGELYRQEVAGSRAARKLGVKGDPEFRYAYQGSAADDDTLHPSDAPTQYPEPKAYGVGSRTVLRAVRNYVVDGGRHRATTPSLGHVVRRYTRGSGTRQDHRGGPGRQR